MLGWLILAAMAIAALGAAIIAIRRENAKNQRWAEAMHELGRRCPDCGGMGWHFGPPGTGDPAISTPTCRTCNGEGKVD